ATRCASDGSWSKKGRFGKRRSWRRSSRGATSRASFRSPTTNLRSPSWSEVSPLPSPSALFRRRARRKLARCSSAHRAGTSSATPRPAEARRGPEMAALSSILPPRISERWIELDSGPLWKVEMLGEQLAQEGIAFFIPDSSLKRLDPFYVGGNIFDFRLLV